MQIRSSRYVVSVAALAAAMTLRAGPAAAQQDALEEVVVTGSRLARPSGFTAPTPLTVVDADAMAATGDISMAETLNRMPSFSPSVTPQGEGTLGVGSAGQTVLDLRGLEPTRTLVLVDGRRFVPATNQGTFDANLVPNILVERAEVVTGGASAAYGSDAVAGVVNLILDDDLSGIRANVQYGETREDDGEETKFALAGGTDVLGGRGHVVAGFEHAESEPVGTCFTRDWCSPNGRTNVWQIGNPGGAGADGYPALVLDYVVSSRMTRHGLVTGGPLRGTQFTADGSVAGQPLEYGPLETLFYMAARPGPDEPFIDGDNLFHAEIPLQQGFDRTVGMAHLDYEFSDELGGFVEFTSAQAESRTPVLDYRTFGAPFLGPSFGCCTIARDNVFLPDSLGSEMDTAGVSSFNMGRIFLQPTEGESSLVERDTYRVALGLDGVLGDEWSWDTYYQYGSTSVDSHLPHVAVPTLVAQGVDSVADPVTGQPVCRSTLTDPDNGCVPINPFGTGTISAAGVEYGWRDQFAEREYEQHVVAVNFQGTPFMAPAGPVAIAAGAEYREDTGTARAGPEELIGQFYTGNPEAMDGEIEVTEAYAEAGVPLTDAFDVNAAARRTHYNTAGTVSTWKAGFTWQPIDLLRVRATRSRDIRAPNLIELFGPQSAGVDFVRDPTTNQDILAEVIAGGNPELNEEIGDTWTAGFILQPPNSNLSVSLDYFDIELAGAISVFGSQNIVDRCAAGDARFCELVERDEAGTLVSVANVNLNLESLSTRGIDIEAAYDFDLADGNLGLRVLATRVFDLITESAVGGTVDRAGQNGWPPNLQPGIPDWKASAGIDYARGPLSVSLNTRWFPEGTFDNTMIGPEDAGYSPDLPNSVSSNRVPGRTYSDLRVGYDFSPAGDWALEVYGIVNNLSDATPPAAPSGDGSFPAGLYDALGRRFTLGLRADF